jgi:Tfp pilus assembly protein PilF
MRTIMKKANLILAAALAAAGVTGGAAALLAPATAVAEAQQKIGSKMMKPLKAAQEAMGEKNWDAALSSLDEAQAIEPKSPYEAFMVDELGWYARLQNKDYAGAAQALERAVASGFVPEADLPQRYRALAQLNFQLQDYGKAVDFGSKYLAANPADQEIAALVAQSKFLQKDYAGARAVVEQASAGVAKPSEPLLLIGLRSSYEMDDRAATARSLEALVRSYPEPKYWDDLLNLQLYQTKSDRDLRTLYRLMVDTKTMNKPEEFSEAATTLMAGGFPTEARKVLDAGMAAGVFQGAALTRAQSDLERARSGAEADRKEMPGADQALAAAKTGNEMVAIGKLYFSVGDYGKAADAFRKGLAKGGVTDTDDANALLGVAQVRAGQGKDAVPAFDAIRDAKLAEVARLWKLYIDTAGVGSTPSG